MLFSISNNYNLSDNSLNQSNNEYDSSLMTLLSNNSESNSNIINSNSYSDNPQAKNIVINNGKIEPFYVVPIVNIDEIILPKIKFLITCHKRGRKKPNEEFDNTINSKKRTHQKSDFDNLQTKIQVHFITFLKDISNDVLLTEFGENKKEYHFKDISYDIKRKVNYKTSEKYKKSTIKDILQKKISNRYKKPNENSENENKDILNEVCKKSNWLNDFFNMKYLNLFEYYYNKEQPLKEFTFNEKNIILSSKTKSFHDLLLKNEDDKAKLIETARRVYFYGYNRLIGKKPFEIK